jgi:hypothetical protein
MLLCSRSVRIISSPNRDMAPVQLRSPDWSRGSQSEYAPRELILAQAIRRPWEFSPEKISGIAADGRLALVTENIPAKLSICRSPRMRRCRA